LRCRRTQETRCSASSAVQAVGPLIRIPTNASCHGAGGCSSSNTLLHAARVHDIRRAQSRRPNASEEASRGRHGRVLGNAAGRRAMERPPACNFGCRACAARIHGDKRDVSWRFRASPWIVWLGVASARAGRHVGPRSLSIARRATVFAPTCSSSNHGVLVSAASIHGPRARASVQPPAVLGAGCVLAAAWPWLLVYLKQGPTSFKACRSSCSIRICAINSFEALPAPRYAPWYWYPRTGTLRSGPLDTYSRARAACPSSLLRLSFNLVAHSQLFFLLAASQFAIFGHFIAQLAPTSTLAYRTNYPQRWRICTNDIH
jgi:hypothetical protein